MRKTMKKISLLITLLASVTTASGCWVFFVGAAAGVGGYAWANGVLTKEFTVSAQKLQTATVKGVKNLKLPVTENRSDRISGFIKSQTSEGKAISITIEAITERSSRLKIRVGTFGDKAMSEMIFNAIQKYL